MQVQVFLVDRNQVHRLGECLEEEDYLVRSLQNSQVGCISSTYSSKQQS